jgi:DHA2 family multidrug resistance protein
MAYSHMRALGQLAGQIQQQAAVMTYSETFYLLALALLACVPLALLLRTPRGTDTPSNAGH